MRNCPTTYQVYEIRPYQILCFICRLGRKACEQYYFEDELDVLQSLIEKNPFCVLKLRCDVESTFRFQNPGDKLDTPEGKSFNLRRDLTILQRLGLLPGAEVPAIDLLRMITKGKFQIDNIAEICGSAICSAEIWQGCIFAETGNYQKGFERILPEFVLTRTLAEREACKKRTAKETDEAKLLRIRPHHLLCMSCFTGKDRPGEYEPILEDNLYEAVENCRNNPDLLIELIAGPCDICPPCHGYYPENSLCAAAFGMGLRDQKKDLDTLRLLGLDYGAKLTAKELFQLLYERIPDQKAVCAFAGDLESQPAWSICGSAYDERYKLAAEDNLGIK